MPNAEVFSPVAAHGSTTYKTISIDGISVAYREAGDPANPKLVLLHGWPSSSHQYRNLIAALAGRFHILAPDYPGFGDSATPDPSSFHYTFDHFAEIIEKFLAEKGFTRYGLYIQDYGGPVGFRLMTKNPKILEWLIIQNTNAFEEGFSAAWASLRDQLWRNRNAQTEAANEGLLQLATVKAVYLTGSPIPELISPDNWNFDYQVTLQRTHGKQLQMDLFYDYRTNVDLYPAWQGFLKQHQPKTIIFWGQGDIFFTPQGGEAYLPLLPHAEMHRLNAGHFAVEDCLPYIAEKMIDFHTSKVRSTEK